MSLSNSSLIFLSCHAGGRALLYFKSNRFFRRNSMRLQIRMVREKSPSAIEIDGLVNPATISPSRASEVIMRLVHSGQLL
jgi:hypothetical protein